MKFFSFCRSDEEFGPLSSCLHGFKKKKSTIVIALYRYKHLNAEFQRIARGDKKDFFSNQCKKIEETTEWERLETSSRKSEIPREHFIQRRA